MTVTQDLTGYTSGSWTNGGGTLTLNCILSSAGEAVVVVAVFTQYAGPPDTGSAWSASVAGITDTAGLSWHKLCAYTSVLGDFEIWWAISPNPLSNDIITPTFNNSLLGIGCSAIIFPSAWIGANLTTPWDANITLTTGQQPFVDYGGEAGPNYTDPYVSNIPNSILQSGISTSASATTLLNFGLNVIGTATSDEAALGFGNWQDAGGGSYTPSGAGGDACNLLCQSLAVTTPQSDAMAFFNGGWMADTNVPWIMVTAALIATGTGTGTDVTAEPGSGPTPGGGSLESSSDLESPLHDPEITGTGPLPSPDTYDDYGTGQGTTTAPYSTGLSPGYPLPFLFAWVDPSENEWDYSMARVDEEILSVDLKHEEGQVPTLEIEIKNPRIGLLNPSRKQWAWLAYQPPPTAPGPAPFLEAGDFSQLSNGYGSPGATNNSAPSVVGTPEYVAEGYVQAGYQVYDGAMIPLTPPSSAPPPTLESPTSVPSQWTPGDTIIPIFFGELLAVPTDLFAEKITLKFIARPMDYIEQKQAVAETLKIPGNYEPIFLDEKRRDDPDAILEGWSCLYHVDRTSLAVTASDVLVGEDGTTVFAESPPSALYKSLKVKIGQAPLTNVQVQANVHWIQRSIGYVTGPDVGVGTYHGGAFLGGWQALHGKPIGGGWTVESAYADDAYMIEYTPTWNISTTTTFYGTLADYDCACSSISESMSAPALLGPALQGQVITTWQVGFCNPYSTPPANTPAKMTVHTVYVPLWGIGCSWTLRYNAKREFTEMAVLTVTANAQAVLTSPTVEQDTLLIKMTGEVGTPVLVYDAWSDFAGQYVPFGQFIFPNDPVKAGGLSYQICIVGGIAGTVEPTFSDVPGTTVADGGVTWASLGEEPQSKIQRMAFNTNYDCGTILTVVEQYFDVNGATLADTETASYFIVTAPGGWKSNGQYQLVNFDVPLTSNDILLPKSATVTIEPVSSVLYSNGTVNLGIPWLDGFSGNQNPQEIVNIGNPSWLGIPVGGTTENVTARCFFPSARGEESLVYGINRARAKIRMRARAVDVSWDCPFDMVVGMSCRQNATIFDPRLPRGSATGKVTSYGMTAKGGKMRGHVTIGCSVGYNAFGNPGADISYSGAVFEPFDDGLKFPLSSLPCDGGVFSPDGPTPDIQDALIAIAIQNPPDPVSPSEGGVGGAITTTTGIGPLAAWTVGIDDARFAESLNPDTIGWSIEIQPVINGPFSGSYAITVTPLELPMGINLAAASSEE